MSTPQLQRSDESNRYPHLTLGDVMGLSPRENAALAEAADGLRREGRLSEALQIWGVLASCNPYESRPWREIAQLQQRVGQHGHAIAAYEMLARIADREGEPTYREALSCQALGEHELAQQLLEHALSLCNDNSPWVAHARRTLESAR